MKRKMGTITVISFALVIMLGAAWPAQGQYTSYATMAPLEQYLIADRSAEIASVRTAAPESISRDAGVLVSEAAAPPSASTQQPQDPIFHSSSGRPIGYWPDNPKRKCPITSKPHLT